MSLYELALMPLLMICCADLTGQSLQYDVIWKGDSVGYIHAHKLDSGHYDVYKITSEVGFWFFGRKELAYEYYTLYEDNSLIKASTRYLKNGHLKSATHVMKSDPGYVVQLDGKDEQLADLRTIEQSINTIYHKEPRDNWLIFSERFGRRLPIESTGPNQYVVEKPDGRKIIYEYKDGICERVVVDHFIARFSFERKN